MKTVLFATAVLTAVLATPAATAVVEIKNISVAWANGVATGPGRPVTYGGNNTTNAYAYFGRNAGSGPSYYEFQVEDIAPVTVVAKAGSMIFPVATFTHHNFPVLNPSLKTVDLRFYAHILVDNVLIGIDKFDFRFTHDETVNFPANGLCPYGGANNQSVNINGCADKVLVNFLKASSSFDVAGVTYTIDLPGFVEPGTTDVKTSFLTEENLDDSAEIVARIEQRGEADAAAVPEPALWARMRTGFGALGSAMRSRRRTVAA